MPEIKHTFHAGKMDKDIDERLVKNGEYRDALNIQVRTTDGDSSGLGDAGTVQNIKGTNLIATSYETISYIDDNLDGEKDKTRIIGSVSDEANDRAFFFTAAPVPEGGMEVITHTDIITASLTNGIVVAGQSERIWVDSIIEVNVEPPTTTTPVFVDRFAVTSTLADAMTTFPSTPSDGYVYITVTDATKYRVGMIVYAQKTDGDHLLSNGDENGVEIININGNNLILAAEQTADLEDDAAVMKFIHKKRVLEFDYYKGDSDIQEKTYSIITGINILDNLLFWTDGKHEPKKINIDRSKEGTVDNNTHTKLYVENLDLPGGVLVPISGAEGSVEDLVTSDIKKEHITVIRKAPKSPPTLHMDINDREGDTEGEIVYEFIQDDSFPPYPSEGDIRIVTFPQGVDYRLDDIFKFVADSTFFDDPAVVRGKVIDISGDNVTLEILFVSDEVLENNPSIWEFELEQKKPLFETKFGRFAYRYQYEDNEYSSFSPWSELAFLPSAFEYTPSKGYNKGMVNNVRELIIKDFIPNDSIRPSDVKMVDILWKPTDSANVYIVKSIKRQVNTEWENFDVDNADSDNTGSMTITTEMIHRVLPANQILRGWDNVPRQAVAQEMTANRLVYGNYIQSYDIDTAFGLKQSLQSKRTIFPNPKKSIKSIRNYQFGVVFGDKYGRETPVIANGYKNELGETISGDLTVEKSLSNYSNKFKLEQYWNTPEPKEWMYYTKYFVKETSNEYYNLVMDRWYDAEDGNVWISFPSVDRNKVDEETYLILKNGHGSQKTITEEARYKVIAIENEAPDYIKTVNRDYDMIFLPATTVYATNVTDGKPDGLIGDTTTDEGRTILTDPGDWASVDIKGEDFKGIPKARIVGYYNSDTDGKVYAFSPWKNITKIINKEEDQEYGVVFREIFEESEVNMYQKILAKLSTPSELTDITGTIDNNYDGGYTNDNIGYYLQLRDAVVENKPQFDGRFFVKLEKDETLSATVLGTQVAHEVQFNYKVAYIAAFENNQASTQVEFPTTGYDGDGPYNGTEWPSNSVFAMNQIQYNPDDANTYELISTINDNATLTDTEGDETVSLFGPGDHGNNANLTEQFWNWWYGNPDDNDFGDAGRTSNIFIDRIPAYSGFGYRPTLSDGNVRQVLQFLGSGSAPISHNINNQTYGPTKGGAAIYPDEDPLESDQNWHPSGLSPGGALNGELGQLTFSVIGSDWDRDDFGTEDSLFKTAMTTPGTIFRFEAYPDNNYKIKSFTQTTFDNFGTFDNPVEIESENFANIEPDHHKRYSIITRFVRLNANNTEIPNSGIDTTIWDPRGEVQHNGVGSMNIQILMEVASGNLSDDGVATNAACWETEPKEDVGLDIYHEASSAIPVRLKDLGDLITFTKPSTDQKRAGGIGLKHRVIDSDTGEGETLVIEQANLPSNTYVHEALGNNAINIKYLASNPDDDPIDLVSDVDRIGIGLAISDEISITHNDGIVTRSKILEHYIEASGTPGDIDVPILSPRVTREGSITNIQGTDNSFVVGTNIQNNNEDGSTMLGTEMVGTGIPPATFVVELPSFSIPGFAGQQPMLLNRKIINIASANYTFKKVTGWYKIDTDVWQYPIDLGWFNCYSFGNGVESDRIRDDFNAPQIDNGVKVSSTFLEYGEETIGSGLIYSGLYNSTSSVNDLNEFNMAEKITKNLNPIYGSIQALKTRDGDVVVLAEDKILKVQANKDAVYNADNNPQIIATNKVLGATIPFAGEYGISKNPESLTWDSYRLYFADRQRGAVLRLSGNGLTPISDVGMKTYFRERLKICDNIIGTFDGVNGEYNLTLNTARKFQVGGTTLPSKTLSFNEQSKGWTSFKSFIPSSGISVSGKYLTTNTNKVWEHYSDTANRNTFYGIGYSSELEVIFNDSPNSIKSFKTVNYEGSQATVKQHTNVDNATSLTTFTDAAGNVITDLTDGQYYNLQNKDGWFIDSFNTDLQEGKVIEFINKENKWFNKINGVTTTLDNLDTNEFSVQGIGFPLAVVSTSPDETTLTIQDTGDDD